MGNGLRRGDMVQFTHIGISGRSAGAGQQDLADPRPGQIAETGLALHVDRQALEDGVVFAVDGQQLGAMLAHRLHEEGAGHHQRLLVGQQNALAGRTAAMVGARPAAPTMAAITLWASG